ncbi:GNAT family N-acetyltransferase [Methanocalculus taiwanensis]|uniref:GNAT family N-acetyltransferase n=1 Tax=Methanocalculus taiwanensis TaxID=106207 RepID=UPI0021019044|nr:GNAT family N-acetyltransferase [Methanocalculus taiwanensis]
MRTYEGAGVLCFFLNGHEQEHHSMTREHNPIASGITIDRFSGVDFDPYIQFYIDIFYEHEPLGNCVGLSREQMEYITKNLYCGEKNLLSQDLCWIARDRSKESRPVGIIACDDPVAAGELEMPQDLTGEDAEKISVVAGVLEEVSRPMQELFGEGEGVCLHVAAIGVLHEYKGRGIAFRLLQAALQDATSRGFRYAFSECANPASRMLHEKAGFRSINSISLSSYTIGGRRPLAHCDLEIYLMKKVLDG